MKVFKLIDRTLLKFVVVGVINTLFGSAVMLLASGDFRHSESD